VSKVAEIRRVANRNRDAGYTALWRYGTLTDPITCQFEFCVLLRAAP